ncbi:outer membrane protein [Bradyrhizobium sp.]|uniref:outer membrane protein n=1 Tax=Bradyrhizobium sp. TaxID=376 RepID=UPI0040376067
MNRSWNFDWGIAFFVWRTATMKTKLIGVLTGVLSLGVAGAATAADMAVKARPAPPPPPVVYNWTGCYIGGNVGGGWASTSQDRVAIANVGPVVPAQPYGSSEGSDFVGGGQIGCDFQFGGNWVIGIQGMYDYARIESSHILPPFPTFTMFNTTKDIWTVTGRIGYLFAPQLLGYVKGGGAWTRQDHVLNGAGPPVFNSENAFNVDRSGWTVGGGLEWMFAPGWSVFAEYNYMDFGTKDVTFVTAPGSVGNPDILRTKLEVSTALVGVNYKFNFGGPVVAKY